MNHFDRQFNRIEKRGNLIFRLAFGWIGFVMLLIVAFFTSVIYFVATLEPKELAHDAGELVSEFKEGMNGE